MIRNFLMYIMFVFLNTACFGGESDLSVYGSKIGCTLYNDRRVEISDILELLKAAEIAVEKKSDVTQNKNIEHLKRNILALADDEKPTLDFFDFLEKNETREAVILMALYAVSMA